MFYFLLNSLVMKMMKSIQLLVSWCVNGHINFSVPISRIFESLLNIWSVTCVSTVNLWLLLQSLLQWKIQGYRTLKVCTMEYCTEH